MTKMLQDKKIFLTNVDAKIINKILTSEIYKKSTIS